MVFPYYPDGTMQQWLKATSPSRVKLCNAFHGVCQVGGEGPFFFLFMQ